MTDDLDALRVEMANERLEHDRAIEIVTDRLDRLEQCVAALASVIACCTPTPIARRGSDDEYQS